MVDSRIAACRAVVYGGAALKGNRDTALATPFAALPDHQVVKRVQDGFETGELDALLARLDTGKLTIAGLDGAYCVTRTAEAAMNRGYQVTLLDAAILTSDPKLYRKTTDRLENRGLSLA